MCCLLTPEDGIAAGLDVVELSEQSTLSIAVSEGQDVSEDNFKPGSVEEYDIEYCAAAW